ncbi:MAG TPA: S41 family peptidase [Candidatus Saccharimonadales bacterium]|nr:S41 family peptidase [Candidatus Saccharimonadales bacterium]
MNPSKLRTILAVVIAGLIGYFIGVNKINIDLHNYKPSLDVTSKEPPASVMPVDFGLFWTVASKIEDNYYDKKAIDPQKMLNGAISGMVDSLDDPYTVYLPPTQNNNFKQGLAGKFEGIGAELGLKNKQIIVVAPLDGSPAKKAGIKPGDAIVKVNDQVILGWTLNQAVDKIRGPKGTTVKLGVVHNQGEPAVDVNITRDTITIKSLTSYTKQAKDIDSVKNSPTAAKIADDKIIYIRLSQFGDSTHDEWEKLANDASLRLKTEKDIKGIVLDLRNNPGGYLNDAEYIISEFVKDGDAVLQEDKNGERTGFPVSGKGLLYDVPVVVLINKGSASASEIVAGGLHDHKRATLVGENSFGKGIVQEAEDLGGGAGLHVTIAKWLTPNGSWVGNGKNGEGLKPDVEIKLDEKNPTHDSQLEKAIEILSK